jgi:hypothetical protein
MSSPVVVPPSEQSDTAVRAEFFAWCAVQTNWSGELEVLENLKTTLGVNGFAVEGIGNALIEEWQATGLAIGFKKRMRASAKKWLAARGIGLEDSD